MSGVLGHKLGRKKSRISLEVSSVKYSTNSAWVLRQVNYVYDCEKPSFASRYMIFGRVNASERKIVSG